MDIEQQLKNVADRYREQGYQVVLRPGPDDLPPFAKDFKVEIVATRADGGVVASVKASAKEFETDRELSRYADVIGKHPRWRYDVFAVGPTEAPVPEDQRETRDMTDAEIGEALNAADRLFHDGYPSQAVVAAWAAAEAAMRQRLRAQGIKAGWGAIPRSMLKELLSSGIVSSSDYHAFLELSHLRNVIVHGFSAPQIEANAVQFLTNAARQLLAEASAAGKAS